MRQATRISRPVLVVASIDAPVKFVPLSYNLLVAQVEDCYATPASGDKYGRVIDGKLDIQVSEVIGPYVDTLANNT